MNNQSIAYFNSNSKGANYLCWGQKDAVVLNNPIDFQALQNFIDAHKKQFIGGFLSYDVKNSIENLTSNNFDGLHFPDCVFFVPSNVVEISANGRPKLSIFRAGFDELMNVLLNGLIQRFNLIFKFLSCA